MRTAGRSTATCAGRGEGRGRENRRREHEHALAEKPDRRAGGSLTSAEGHDNRTVRHGDPAESFARCAIFCHVWIHGHSFVIQVVVGRFSVGHFLPVPVLASEHVDTQNTLPVVQGLDSPDGHHRDRERAEVLRVVAREEKHSDHGEDVVGDRRHEERRADFVTRQKQGMDDRPQPWRRMHQSHDAEQPKHANDAYRTELSGPDEVHDGESDHEKVEHVPVGSKEAPRLAPFGEDFDDDLDDEEAEDRHVCREYPRPIDFVRDERLEHTDEADGHHNHRREK